MSPELLRFSEKAHIIHAHKYCYNSIYKKNNRNYAVINCPVHGSFEQACYLHLNSRGCPECGKSKSNTPPKNVETFIQESRLIHSNEYDYSLVNYVNAKTKVSIICPTHGVFEQTPTHHLSGKGCRKCSIQDKIKTNQNFLDEANIIHDGKYDYSESLYTHSQTKISIVCPVHGEFFQTPNVHLSMGCGCPKCGSNKDTSKAELEILDFIKSLGINNIEQSNREVLDGKEIDIYLPDYKLAIEYNGLYHHSSFGRGLRNSKPPTYHLHKFSLCRAAGISLIQVFEDEWVNPIKRPIWESVIRHKLGLTSEKIYARKCIVRVLSWPETELFLSENHLMGYDSAPIRLGLFLDNSLLACLTFAKPSLSGGNKKYNFNLSRFAVKRDTTIVGGFSKLLKHFLKLNPNKTLSTAADLRYSTGDVYTKNGFKLTHETRPNYWYWRASTKKVRLHRFGFRKQVLNRKLDYFNKSLTEKQNMINHGWNIIYDAGNAMFEYVNEN